MAYLIGVDIGTSGTKAVLFDENGTNITNATFEYPLYQPQPLFAEQEPEDWYVATINAIKTVIAKSGVKAEDIKAIGLAGQMHGLVMLDKDNNVLDRSIIWCDQRTAAECDDITNLVGKERLIEITANPALTGFTASKIMWVKKNKPQIYDKCAKILLPKDYVLFRLTGEFATEVSDASGMQLLDVPNRKWSDEVLSKLGIDKGLLATVHESEEIVGTITREIAELTGLKEGTFVGAGAGDQAACAVGNGIIKPGIVSSNIGTSGVVFAFTDKPLIDKLGRVHTFCHAVKDTWHIMGVTQGAGLSLKWFRDNFSQAEMNVAKNMDVDPYFLMDKIAEQSNVGCDGLVFLPYLMGERTPHLDALAKGVFYGITARHTYKDMLRAVMEGVSFSLLDCMNIIREMGALTSEVRVAGGGGRSKLWKQMQADAFNCPITTINQTENGALGVALLAGVGAKIYSNIGEAVKASIKPVSTQDAIEENVKTYIENYEIYKALYPALKKIYTM